MTQDTVKDLCTTMEKEFGKGIIRPLDGAVDEGVAVIRTGTALDVEMGIGGLPCGRIVEIFGEHGTGRTTLALWTIASAQAAGGICAYIDLVHDLDQGVMQQLGVKLPDLMVSQPGSLKQALEVSTTLVRSGVINLLVLDSGETPIEELDDLPPRFWSTELRKLTAIAHKTGCLVLFVSPSRSTNGLKFYASVRIRLERAEAKRAGAKGVIAKIVKNKFAPPFCEALLEPYPS